MRNGFIGCGVEDENDVSQRKTLLHVITGLADGGAEANLYRLCVGDTDNRHVVVSLTDDGKYGSLLRKNKIDVHSLNMRRGSASQLKIWDLIDLLRMLRPDVVQTWMYHGCLVGSIAAKYGGALPVVWGIHHAKLDRQGLKPMTFAVMKVLGKISWHLSDAVVYCAKSAAATHRQHGYRTCRERIIPNGYDLTIFTPSFPVSQSEGQATVRLGMVARWHPIKDHINLFQALQKVGQDGVGFELVLAGSGMDGDNPELLSMLANYGLELKTKMLGAVDHVPDLMRSLDLHILSSKGEAFPNVLAEAMACGTPCITTDVGDSSDIVGDTGWVVPPKNPNALASAIELALSARKNEEWQIRRNAARKRIEEKFSVARMVDGYNAVWREVLSAAA